jgi:hypothetical protein
LTAAQSARGKRTPSLIQKILAAANFDCLGLEAP